MADSETDPEISDALGKSSPSGPLQTRVRRTKQWVLLSANRWLITGLLLVASFVLIVLVGVFGPVSVNQFIVGGVSPGLVLVELLKTIVSIVTIVLAINSLVLSPQLGPVSDQREILEDAMSLRKNTEDVLDSSVTPSSPREFLRAITTAVGNQAESLRHFATGDEQLQKELRQYSDEVTTDTERVLTNLENTQFGKFEVMPVVMNFNTSPKIRRVRHLRQGYAESLSEADQNMLDDMVDVLELFITAREYLKTIYIRSEFINFSRALLYVGLPALLLTFLATQLYSDTVFPGATFGVANRLWFVSAAVTAALTPFAVLISYVARLATLSQSTLFLAPFVAGADSHDTRSK